MLPPFPCDQISVGAPGGPAAYQAVSRTPSLVVMGRSSIPGGGSGTYRSGKKIRLSSGSMEQPKTKASPTSEGLEIPARLLVRRRLLLPALDPLAGDHVLVAHTRRDHRIDVRALVDHDLEERRPRERNELLEVLPHVGELHHPPRELEAVGLDRLHEVLLVERLVRARVAVRVEEVLPLPDHAVAEVVQEEHLHRDVVRGERL